MTKRKATEYKTLSLINGPNPIGKGPYYTVGKTERGTHSRLGLHPRQLLTRRTRKHPTVKNVGDMYSLQQILGHTTLEMVKKYVHLAQNKTVSRFANFCPLDNLDKK